MERGGALLERDTAGATVMRESFGLKVRRSHPELGHI